MSNQAFGSHDRNPWGSFDALHPTIRRLIAHAPYDMNATSALRFVQDFKDVASARRAVGIAIFKIRDAEIRRVWGEDHPMYGARPEGWRI